MNSFNNPNPKIKKYVFDSQNNEYSIGSPDRINTDIENNLHSKLSRENFNYSQSDNQIRNNNAYWKSNSKSNLFTGKYQDQGNSILNNEQEGKFDSTNLNTRDFLLNLQDKTYELNAQMEEINKIKHINISLENTIQILENESNLLKEELQLANKRISNFSTQENKFSSKINQMKINFQSTLDENSNLKLNLKEKEKEIERLNELVTEVQLPSMENTKYSLIKKEYDDLVNEFENFKTEAFEKEQQKNEKMRKIHEDYKKEFSQLSNSYKADIDAVTSQLNLKVEEYLKLSEAFQKINKENELFKENTTKEIEYLKEDLEVKLKKCTALDKKKLENEQLIKDLNNKYTQLQDDLSKKIKILKDENEKLINENEKFKREYKTEKGQKDLNDKINSILKSDDVNNLNLIKSRSNSNLDTPNLRGRVDTYNNLNNKLNCSIASIIKSGGKYKNSSQSPIKQNLSFIQNENTQPLVNNYLENENKKLKNLINTQINDINSLNQQLRQDKNYFDGIISQLKFSNEEKSDEISSLVKKIKKQSKIIIDKEEEISQIKSLLNEYKSSFQNEISNKNEEIFQLKQACDKMLSRVYSNMERALYG
jgi:chromosome segregation ATPase